MLFSYGLMGNMFVLLGPWFKPGKRAIKNCGTAESWYPQYTHVETHQLRVYKIPILYETVSGKDLTGSFLESSKNPRKLQVFVKLQVSVKTTSFVGCLGIPAVAARAELTSDSSTPPLPPPPTSEKK